MLALGESLEHAYEAVVQGEHPYKQLKEMVAQADGDYETIIPQQFIRISGGLKTLEDE